MNEICTCKDPYTSDIVHTDDEGCCIECGELYTVRRYSKEVEVDKAQERKNTPIFSGVLAYFPKALAEVSRASLAGNKQHLEGQPLHWDRSKSKDQLDALTRHLIDHASGEIVDDDGVYHLAKVCWRGLAQLELLIESQNE